MCGHKKKKKIVFVGNGKDCDVCFLRGKKTWFLK